MSTPALRPNHRSVQLLTIALLASALTAAATPPASAAETGPLGATTRISVHDTHGAQASLVSVRISPDGRSLLLQTPAPLVPGDTNGEEDVYLQDRATGSVEWISQTADGSPPNGDSFIKDLDSDRMYNTTSYPIVPPAPMSDDGRFVAFWSTADNLTGTDANGPTRDVFLRDRLDGTTTLVSVSSQGEQGDGMSLYASVSDDGRTVAFSSLSSLVEGGDPPYESSAGVYVHDVDSGETERAVRLSLGGEVPAPIPVTPFPPEISGNGRFLVFEHLSPLFHPTDPNASVLSVNNIYVFDRVSGATERVSVASDGSEGQWGGAASSSIDPLISADGRYVSFRSFNSNYVHSDTNSSRDAFVFDRKTGRIERLVGSDGQQGDGEMLITSISGDGRFATGLTSASNLGYQDGNVTLDVVRIDRLTGQVDLVSTTPQGTPGNLSSSAASISSDGRYVAFRSSATDLVDDGSGGGWFLRDLGPPMGAGGLAAAPGPEGVEVSGWARLSAGPIAESEDSDHDAAAVARDAGAELTGADLTYRPERKDLRIRLDLAPWRHVGRPLGFPLVWDGVPTTGALTYAAAFTVDGTRYEARAVAGPTGPTFSLYRCADACAKVADLSGGIWTAGDNVLISLPLGLIGAGEGSALVDGFAYVAAGEELIGPAAVLDQVDLPVARIPASTVALAIAQRGTEQGAVDFDHSAQVVDGHFSSTLPAPGAGDHDAWARVCLGEACAASFAPVEG